MTGRLRVLLLLGPLAAACADPPPISAPPVSACQCTAAGCPREVCDLELEVASATCAGQVGQVEVLLGGKLEAQTWQPGVRRRTCATIARGTVATLHARADTDWQWVEEIACPAATPSETVGLTLPRQLHCNEATSAGDTSGSTP